MRSDSSRPMATAKPAEPLHRTPPRSARLDQDRDHRYRRRRLHPDLSGKIAYQHCFITEPDRQHPAPQSTGNFSTDEDGHGTDVSGIAAATTGNGLGFSGAGGKSVIYAYRVFPTPDDTCASETLSDDQCSAATADIASAINDAVAQGVNVISMSLGGGSCTNGVDSDPSRGPPSPTRSAHNVIVVAASGNGGAAQCNRPGMHFGRHCRGRNVARRRLGHRHERSIHVQPAPAPHRRRTSSSTLRRTRSLEVPERTCTARLLGASSRRAAIPSSGNDSEQPALDREYLDDDAVHRIRRRHQLHG